MREYETKEVLKQEEYVTKIICNRCNNEGQPTEFEDEIKNISINFSYESPHDGQTWHFDLCEECIVDIVKQFKHVPEGFKDNHYEVFTRKQHQYIFDKWKLTGEWEEMMFITYDELKRWVGLWDIEYINNLVKRYHPSKPLLEEIK